MKNNDDFLKEFQRLQDLEIQYLEESKKLVEVNVNNALLLAEVQSKNKQIQSARRDIQNILENLGQGFMTCNLKGLLLKGSSKKSHEMFGYCPDGKMFWEILDLNPEQTDFLKQWFDMIAAKALDFDDLIPLGPKEHIKNGRIIEFEYRAINNEKGDLEKIIVIATDRTRERELAAKADADEIAVKMMITSVRDPEGFADCITEIRHHLESLSKEFSKKINLNINSAFRSSHTIKGTASAYHMIQVTKAAHSLEDSLALLSGDNDHQKIIQMIPKLVEKYQILVQEFESTMSKNKDIFQSKNNINCAKIIETKKLEHILNLLVSQLGHDSYIVQEFKEFFVFEGFEAQFLRFDRVAEEAAAKLGKQVALSIHCDPVRVYVEAYKPFLQTLIHAIRNAVDHGIEFPEQRQSVGKNTIGQIGIMLDQLTEDGTKKLRFRILDDGRGVDPEQVGNLAVQRKIISEEQRRASSDEDIIQLLFRSGFSTSDRVTEISGRGVGLDAIAAEASKLGGQTWLESKQGAGSTLTIITPLIVDARFNVNQNSQLKKVV